MVGDPPKMLLSGVGLDESMKIETPDFGGYLDSNNTKTGNPTLTSGHNFF